MISWVSVLRANGCHPLVLLWKLRPFSHTQWCVLKAFELIYRNCPCVPCGYQRSHPFSAENRERQGSDKRSLPVLWATSLAERERGTSCSTSGSCAEGPGHLRRRSLVPGCRWQARAASRGGHSPTVRYSTEGKKPWKRSYISGMPFLFCEVSRAR